MKFVADIVVRQNQLIPHREAVVDDAMGKVITYGQLFDRCKRLANALSEIGLNPGDRVAMVLGNCYVCAELIYGITMAGMIMVNVNERLREQEMEYILEDSGAKAVITNQEMLPLLNRVRQKLPHIKTMISIDGGECDVDYEPWLSASSNRMPDTKVLDPDTTALLIYTSGTTGKPKGVQLTHRNLIQSATNFLIEGFHNPNGTYLACMPYYHVVCVPHMAALMRGMRVVVTRFEVKEVLKLIEKYRITHAFLVPTMIAMLLEDQESHLFDLSSLETIFYAAAPIPVALLERAIARFGPIFCQMYGLTETSSLVTVLRREEHVVGGDAARARRLASCGRETMHVDVRIVDEKGNDVPPGEPGEIIVRGETIMEGYWGRPEATAEVLKEGWFYTGDIGKRDEEGYVYIVDRKKDVIISGGVNIYPREVEEVLYTHPAIREAAVIGVPDEKWGETVLAVVVVKPGFELTETDVMDFCKENLAGYKKPRKVEFMDELPRNSVGKINKEALRKKYWVGHDRNVI